MKYPIFLFLFTFFFLSPPLEAKTVRYKWEQQYYGLLKGQQSLLFSREMRNSKLAFADIDGDGDQDVFMGKANGEIAFFENQGTEKKPNFVLLTQQYKAIFELRKKGKKIKVWNQIDVGENSAPFLVDIDNDGDYDLFIGSNDGRIWQFENQGNNLIPVFKLITPKFENILVGKNSAPVFYDVNLQRKFDLLIGTVDGKVWLFYNEGTRFKPDFKSKEPTKVVDFGLETHASPSLFDWDNDQDLDMLVGQKNGTLSLYINEGDRFFPNWKLKEDKFQQIDIGGESAPVFVDLDHDQDPDMVIGSANPTVSYYENRIQGGNHVLWNITTNLFHFNKLVITGNRASIAAGDLDGDKDLDLIVGEKTGNLNYFENKTKTNVPDWELITEDLIFMTGMENSAPTLGDLDQDGDLDLLIGDKQGRIAFVENTGNKNSPKWQLRDKTYFRIDVGSNAVPRLLDIDKDGDLDLLIGNFTGRVILYLNKGTPKEPLFALEATRFASAKAERNAVPSFFDWNQDQLPDLILGDAQGKLQLYLNPGPDAKDTVNWPLDTEPLSTFDVSALSHPIFDDFDGDGAPDLLIGNEEGDFLLYLNKGTETEDQALQVVVDNSIDQKAGSLVVENVEGPIELDITEEVTSELEDEGSLEPLDLSLSTLGREEQQFIDPKWVRVATPLLSNRHIRRSSPTFGDLDQDGDFDLIVGTSTGKLFYFENEGSDKEWDFKEKSNDFLKIRGVINTAPLLIDLDQDGDLDLLVGTGSGQLLLYVNQGSSEKANFVLDKAAFHRIWLGKNSRPGVLDLNNDNILDILVGNLWGKLIYIQNEADRFAVIRRDYQAMDVGIGSTPNLADINNDNQLELMVGSDAGPIHFYRNSGPGYSGQWELLPHWGGEQNFAKGTSPTAVDLDNDGDLDLVTGSDVGVIFLYRNDAIIHELDEQNNLEEP